jgi:hypothetical protein
VYKDKSSKLNMFGGGDDLQTVANEIYGGSSEIPDSGRVVARPTAIDSIWADVRQPRRAIPLSIRMHWNGDPADVAALFEQWHKVAAAEADQQIDVRTLLLGEGEGIDTDKFPSVAQEFVKLVRLAAHIKENGLINPITVIESDGRLLIESGERRWLAHHLLHLYLGDQWAKVPAAKGNATDSIWRQAGENTQRRELNAIGMARQLALLIMAARGTPPIANGTPYQEYEDIVGAGVCDRRYYAQVADGNVHRIPRGMGERIQGAMGLGLEQLSQYRRLLKLTDDDQINDALWVRADVENWAENTLREVATLTAVKVRAVIERDGWTLDNLKALKDVPVALPPMTAAPQPVMPVRRPVTSEWMHKTVVTKGGLFCRVVGVDGDWITVILPDQKRKSFHFSELTIAADRQGSAPTTPAPTATGYGYAIGDRVRTRTGAEGEVVGLSGRLIHVRTKNGTTSHDHSLLMKLPKGDSYQRPPQVDADPEPVLETFAVGEAVNLIDTEEVGKVAVRHGDDLYGVHVFGAVGIRVLNSASISSLNMTWDEYAKEAQLPLPQREYNEGWTEGESGSNLPAAAIDTDKANSLPQNIIPVDSTNWSFVFSLRQVAECLGDEATAAMLLNVLQMTDVNAITMQDAQTLKPTLDETYDRLKLVMGEWLEHNFAGVLQLVVDAAQ